TYLDIIRQLTHSTHENKINPSRDTHSCLLTLQSQLREMELSKSAYLLKRRKGKYFTQGNGAGATLASKLKEWLTNAKIAFLHDSVQGKKILDPQNIANEFASYYSTLYNLSGDPNLQHPLTQHIDQFLE
ncbi:Hypothetical predicted protein, partial [Pelobates cultripes]